MVDIWSDDEHDYDENGWSTDIMSSRTRKEDIRMTKVVHCKKEPYDVYIGRPSKWGNPFSHKAGTLAHFKVSSVDEAIECYETWVRMQPALMSQLGELRGKILGCWCKPGRCHGDVLVKLVKEVYGDE